MYWNLTKNRILKIMFISVIITNNTSSASFQVFNNIYLISIRRDVVEEGRVALYISLYTVSITMDYLLMFYITIE